MGEGCLFLRNHIFYLASQSSRQNFSPGLSSQRPPPFPRGWAPRCLPPELGRGPGFSAFPGCFFPRLSRPSLPSGSIHSGTWLPLGQVACRGPGSHGGWWGWPQSGHFPLSCLFLGATPDPSPAPTLSLLPRLFTETPVLPAGWAEGLGAPAEPNASFSPLPPPSPRPASSLFTPLSRTPSPFCLLSDTAQFSSSQLGPPGNLRGAPYTSALHRL